MTKLCILIPTLPEPESQRYLTRLNQIIDPQIARYSGEVEKYIHDAPRSMPTGTKRNEMIRNTESDYFVQIDVDDLPAHIYVDEIMKAIDQNPDVITFKGFMTTDGMHRRDFEIRLNENYEERNGKYYRWPNHLCAFKRSLVEHIKFQPIWQQEDYFWSKEIHDKGLLKSEVHIDASLYHYDFRDKNKPQQQKTHSRIINRRLR